MTVSDEKNQRRLIARDGLVDALNGYGLSVDCDPRLRQLNNFLPEAFESTDLYNEAVESCMPLLNKAFRGELVVPNFGFLTEKCESLFSNMCNTAREGEYLSGEESLDVATIDGQCLHLGKDNHSICADELISVLVVLVAIEQLGLERVREFTNFEPSGESANSKAVNSEGLPFNPFMWNGMLALCALLQSQVGDAFEVVADAWRSLRMGPSEQPVQCDEAWLAEDRRKHYHRVMSLLHQSLDGGKFPPVQQEKQIVDLFFQLRSISGTSEDLCSVAACLAHGGVNPWTKQRICKSENAKHILSLLYSSGCETQSGEFSFQVGVPAKSSREGVVMMVIPNIAGICVAGSSLNRHFVSKAGLGFCFAFSALFNCHALAGASTAAGKYDPTLYNFHTDLDLCSDLLEAAESANFHVVKALTGLGFDVNYADYDGRSAAHLAASRGHCKLLKYLAKHGADMGAKDRWQVTPLQEAESTGNALAAEAIRSIVSDINDFDTESDNGGQTVLTSKLQTVHRTGSLAAAARALTSLQEDGSVYGDECSEAG